MTYTVENSLTNFDFWSGAKENVKMLTCSELETLDDLLQDIYCDRTPTETEINDLFWFDFETVCDLLGYTYDASTNTVNRGANE